MVDEAAVARQQPLRAARLRGVVQRMRHQMVQGMVRRVGFRGDQVLDLGQHGAHGEGFQGGLFALPAPIGVVINLKIIGIMHT
jgi:hypothetical protein